MNPFIIAFIMKIIVLPAQSINSKPGWINFIIYGTNILFYIYIYVCVSACVCVRVCVCDYIVYIKGNCDLDILLHHLNSILSQPFTTSLSSARTVGQYVINRVSIIC